MPSTYTAHTIQPLHVVSQDHVFAKSDDSGCMTTQRACCPNPWCECGLKRRIAFQEVHRADRHSPHDQYLARTLTACHRHQRTQCRNTTIIYVVANADPLFVEVSSK